MSISACLQIVACSDLDGGSDSICEAATHKFITHGRGVSSTAAVASSRSALY